MPSSRSSTRPVATIVPVALLVAALIGGCVPAASGAVAGAVGTPGSGATSASAGPTASTPSPSPTPTPIPTSAIAGPAPTPTATLTPAAGGPYAINLYGKGDFVSQTTDKQCVAAALQIMLNIVGPTNDRTAATQARLAKLAKRLSDTRDRGTEPLGWARGLEERGAGGYEVVVEPTMGAAVRRAIAAIRETGRPVGLLVWRGAHSWVLHGFETSADPAVTDDFKVTGLWVSDPWYPRVSSIWGPSRKPNQRITVKQLREDYLRWKRPTGRYPAMDGQYVLVVPVDRSA